MSDGGGYRRRRIAQRAVNRVAKRLASTLEPGETLESALFAHRYVPGLFLLLFLGSIGDLIYVLVAQPYYLALTNNRFLLLKGSRWGWASRPRDVVYEAPADSVRIEQTSRYLVRAVVTVRALGVDETRLAVHRQYWKELDHMRSLLTA